jgi:hypothetical protein
MIYLPMKQKCTVRGLVSSLHRNTSQMLSLLARVNHVCTQHWCVVLELKKGIPYYLSRVLAIENYSRGDVK